MPSAAILFADGWHFDRWFQPEHVQPLWQSHRLPLGFNFILGARRTGVQRIANFQRQTTTGVGHNVFHPDDQFRTQTVRELTFQQHLPGRNVAPGCREVAAEIADAPFDIGINDRSFFSLVTKRSAWLSMYLDTRIERFH